MQQLLIEACPRDKVELISDALEELGALSVTFTDQFDDPILEPELGSVPLWPHVVIQALFEELSDAEQAKKTLSIDYSYCRFALDELPELDWERVCINDFKPQQFGKRLWICPSWHKPPEPDAVNLILDPGLAFGTGAHPTTALCLTWLESHPRLCQENLIDYGCGSGILALAALKLGAQHVYAVDIDQQALTATRNNAMNNQVDFKQLGIGYPEQLNEPVQIIIANILLAPLIQLKLRFKELLLPSGILVVSGILATQVDELVQNYQSLFQHCDTSIQGDWALVTFNRTRLT